MTNSMPDILVSLICPCHNRFRELSQLLQSIPQRKDIEVILVDDHSEDDLTALDLTKFPNYKYIRNDTSRRYAGSARNLGIEHSNGEYLFFADSDDLIIANGFLKCMENIAKDKPDVLFAKATSFVECNNNLGNRHIKGNWLMDQVARGADARTLARVSGPYCKFIRRDFIDRYKIRYEAQRVCNDSVFAALLVAKQPVVAVCDLIVYSIRQGNPSLINDFSIDSTEMRLSALLRYNKVLADHGLHHLMAPALPFLYRLLRKKNPIRMVSWAWIFLKNRQPALVTWWTLKNSLRRWWAL